MNCEFIEQCSLLADVDDDTRPLLVLVYCEGDFRRCPHRAAWLHDGAQPDHTGSLPQRDVVDQHTDMVQDSFSTARPPTSKV